MTCISDILEQSSGLPVDLAVTVVAGTRYPDGDVLTLEDHSGQLDVWVPREWAVPGTAVHVTFTLRILQRSDSVTSLWVELPTFCAQSASGTSFR